MAYDLHGSWENQVDHHAPLYRRSWDTTSLNVDFGIGYWASKGMSKSKMNMGIPFYGRSWILSTSAVSPLSPASGPGTQGSLTMESGFLAYYEVCSFLRSNGWTQKTDPNNLMGPYAYLLASKNWVGYDDVNMVVYKTNYALASGLGGVMVWDISMDDFQNTCAAGVNPLINAIYSTLNGNASSVATTVVAASNTTTTTTTTTTGTTNVSTKTAATLTPATAAVTTVATSGGACKKHDIFPSS